MTTRQRITLCEIADRRNLLLATWKAARGRRNRPSIVRYLCELETNLERLADEILSERSPLGHVRSFVIHDPKRRTITAPCFTDRILHHAILNRAEARFERMLVPTTYACRPGKGVHAAVRQVQTNLRKHSTWRWIVQIDIDGYFPSIDHAVLRRLLRRRFKGDPFLALLDRIISAAAPNSGRGLPIGSLTSQHFANAYLDSADRLLLAHKAVCAHVRYMDDLIWWCRSRDDAVRTLEELDAHLTDDLKLRLKPSVHIGPARRGARYCGFRIRPGIILASSRKMSRYRTAMRRIEDTLAADVVTEREAQRAHDSAFAALSNCETYRFRSACLANRSAGALAHV